MNETTSAYGQPAIRTTPHPTCKICGSPGKVLHHDLNDCLFGVPGRWSSRQCSNVKCGLFWLDPQPLEADLPLAYRNYYTHGIEAGVQGTGTNWRDVLYRLYLAGRAIPATLLGLSKERARIQHMFLDTLPPGRLLDVGCGAGDFLHRMHQKGWIVAGLDFDVDAIKNAKLRYGLDLIHSDLVGAQFPENSFDAVTMNHVIEHVPDPISLLTEVRRVLKPGGLLVVTTPNIMSWGHSKFGVHWRGLEPPRHLQVFSVSALRLCAEKCSLKVQMAVSSAANADIIIGASFGIEEAARNSRLSAAHQEIHLFRGIRSLWLQCLEAILMKRCPHLGEEAVLICRK